MIESTYIEIPAQRGVYEIEPLVTIVNKYGGYIMGGYVRYMASIRTNPIVAYDVDIFTNSEETLSAIRTELEKVHFLVVSADTANAVTYEKPTTGVFARCPKIQLVKPKIEGAIVTTGTVEEILNNFDFTITRVALKNDGRTILACDTFQNDEEKGFLKIRNIHCPISSMLRAMKYARKGFHMRHIEALKLFNDWTSRDESYRTKVVDGLEKAGSETMTKEELEELYGLLNID